MEPQQSLHIFAPALLSRQLACTLSVEDSDAPGMISNSLLVSSVKSEVCEDPGEMLAWGGNDCAVTFAIDDVVSQRIGGALSLGDSIPGWVGEGSPSLKLGTFNLGFKHLALPGQSALPMYKLSCTILECDGLIKSDRFAENDVYVKISAAGSMQQTSTVFGGGTAPSWSNGRGETLAWKTATVHICIHQSPLTVLLVVR